MKKYQKPTVKWMEIESEEMMLPEFSNTNATEGACAKGHSCNTDWDDDDYSDETAYSNRNIYGVY